LQGRLGRAADGLCVDVHVAGRHLSGDLRAATDEVDDHAVLGDDHVLRVDPGLDGEVGVGLEVPPLPVDRHHVRGADDVVAVDQLPSAGVPGDVDLGVALVNDLGAPA